MALGGGYFTNFNKKVPGTYYRVVTLGSPRNDTITGVTAGGIVSDWAPEGKIFTIEAEDFMADPVKVTGYPYSAPQNETLREVFKYANTLIAYKLNTGGAKAQMENVGEALNEGSIGNNITVSVLKNVLDESKYDVTTYLNGEEKDKQVVTQGGIDEIELTKGQEKSGTPVENATASFTFNKNTVKVTFANVPDGYKHTVRVKGQIGSILAFVPGRCEESVSGLTHTVTYSPGAAINGTMTIEAVLTKDKTTVINSCTYTCRLIEDAQVGADGTKLMANDFVSFAPTVIMENAGYVFSGGRSGSTINAASHSNFLNKLEGRRFNDLFYDGDTDEIKELYLEYTKRLRDTRGNYFQTVVGNYAQADYEGLVSVYNQVLGSENTQTLAPWLAGRMSAISLEDEVTNKIYNGELTANTDISQSRLEALIQSGHFVFHDTDLNEVSTLIDVNTFRSFTEDKNEDMSQNKVIRVVDHIGNSLARIMNKNDIGKLNNDDNGRNILWLRVDNLLTELKNLGAIMAYEPTDIEVLPVPNKPNAVQINLRVDVNETIREIYITTYVISQR